MKKVSLLLFVLLACTAVSAQQQVATLIHNGTMRAFYGSNAFVQAHNASVSGDVINLSSGMFAGCNITKNITLRGMGWKGAQNTMIEDNVYIRIPSADTVSNLNIEGIYFTEYFYWSSVTYSPFVARCRFKDLCLSQPMNGTFANCVVDLYRNPTNSSSIMFNVFFVNSAVNCNIIYNSTFTNCILSPYYSGWNVALISAVLTNCICYPSSYDRSSTLSSSDVYANNCVSTSTPTDFFKYCKGANNQRTTAANLFVTPPTVNSYGIVFTDSTSFELTPTAQALYLGNDSTQVGVYGGLLPFAEAPSYPHITKMNVSNQSTAEGKLNVEIEVTPAE